MLSKIKKMTRRSSIIIAVGLYLVVLTITPPAYGFSFVGKILQGIGTAINGVVQGCNNAVNSVGQGLQGALKWKAETCPFRQTYLAGQSSGLAYEIGKQVDNAYKSMGGTNNEIQQSDCALCNIAAGVMGVQPVSGGSSNDGPVEEPSPTAETPQTENSTAVTSAIKVYSLPGCLACQDLKDFLTEQNIPFEHIDVSVDQTAAQRVIEITGQTGVPVLEINGTFVVGFERAKGEELLALIPAALKENKTADTTPLVSSASTEILGIETSVIKDTLTALGADTEALAALLQAKGASATMQELVTATGLGKKTLNGLRAEIDIEHELINGLTEMLGNDNTLGNLPLDELLADTGTAELTIGALLPLLGTDATVIDDLLAVLTEDVPHTEPVVVEQPVTEPEVAQPAAAVTDEDTTGAAGETIDVIAGQEDTATAVAEKTTEETRCVGYTLRRFKQKGEDGTEKEVTVIVLYPTADCAMPCGGSYPLPSDRTPYGNMCRDAEIDAKDAPYPLVVLLDEAGGVPGMNYRTIALCQTLAKQGYVAALSLPNPVFPYIPDIYLKLFPQPDKVSIKRHADITTVIEGILELSNGADPILSGAIDPAAIGVLGRYCGARAAEEACGANAAAADARVRAGVFLSPINAGLSAEDAAGIIVPTMTIFDASDTRCPVEQNKFVYDNAGVPKYCGVLPPLFPHYVSPAIDVLTIKSLFIPCYDLTTIPAIWQKTETFQKVKAVYITAFFNRYLKDNTGADKILQTQDPLFVSYEYKLEAPPEEEDSAADVELGNKDFGKTVKAAKGDVIKLTLWGNYYESEQPGYQWNIVYFDKNLLELEKVEHGAASVDNGGIKSFTESYFKAVNTGSAMVIAGYHKAGKYAGVFLVNVDILEPPEENPEQDYAPNDVIIGFKEKVTLEKIKKAMTAAELTGEPLNEALSIIPCLAFLAHTTGIAEVELIEALNVCVVTITASGEDIPALCHLLMLFPEVKYSQPNYRRNIITSEKPAEPTEEDPVAEQPEKADNTGATVVIVNQEANRNGNYAALIPGAASALEIRHRCLGSLVYQRNGYGYFML